MESFSGASVNNMLVNKQYINLNLKVRMNHTLWCKNRFGISTPGLDSHFGWLLFVY